MSYNVIVNPIIVVINPESSIIINPLNPCNSRCDSVIPRIPYLGTLGRKPKAEELVMQTPATFMSRVRLRCVEKIDSTCSIEKQGAHIVIVIIMMMMLMMMMMMMMMIVYVYVCVCVCVCICICIWN